MHEQNSDYVPMASHVAPAPLAPPPPRDSRSASSLIMALLPLAVFAIVIAWAMLAGGTIYLAVMIAIVVLAMALSVVLARYDQSRLAEKGFEHPTRPALALLPIAYLFVRGNRAWQQSATGLAPAWLHVASIVAVFACTNLIPLVATLADRIDVWNNA